MSKDSNTTRFIGPPVKDKDMSRLFFDMEMKASNSVKELSYYDEATGGFLVWQKGHKGEAQGKENNEYLFALGLAKNGYMVYLTPEDKKNGGISFRKSKKGDDTYPDGKAKGEKASFMYYEQRTPDQPNVKYGALVAFEHASDKGVPIAAIFDKNGVMHRSDIEKGMRLYEEGRLSGRKGYLKLKGAIVYNARGELNTWRFDDLIKK